jgi:hypothetical protein
MKRRHWPTGLGTLAYGGDYTPPEQRPKPLWQDDVRLMRETGVTMVSAGIRSYMDGPAADLPARYPAHHRKRLPLPAGGIRRLPIVVSQAIRCRSLE